MTFFRVAADGLVLTVRASPKASRNAVQGLMRTPDGHALKVAVTAPPDKGKANDAVIDVLAKAFKVPKSAVTLVAGETDRRKVFRISGEPAGLAATAQQWISP